MQRVFRGSEAGAVWKGLKWEWSVGGKFMFAVKMEWRTSQEQVSRNGVSSWCSATWQQLFLRKCSRKPGWICHPLWERILLWQYSCLHTVLCSEHACYIEHCLQSLASNNCRLPPGGLTCFSCLLPFTDSRNSDRCLQSFSSALELPSSLLLFVLVYFLQRFALVIFETLH